MSRVYRYLASLITVCVLLCVLLVWFTSKLNIQPSISTRKVPKSLGIETLNINHASAPSLAYIEQTSSAENITEESKSLTRPNKVPLIPTVKTQVEVPIEGLSFESFRQLGYRRRAPKYYSECGRSGHVDSRFPFKLDFKSELKALVSLIQNWSKFVAFHGLVSWIAHGTLLGTFLLT